MNSKFKLFKSSWDLISLKTIKEAADPSSTAELAAVLLEGGLANVCLVTRNMTVPLARIEQSIPKQRQGSSNTQKATEKFYQTILHTMLSKFNFEVLKAVIIASPGFYKDDFHKWLLEEAFKKDIKPIVNNKHMFLLCRASSGHKYSLKEILQDPLVLDKLVDVKATREIGLLEKFHETFNREPNRAFYGYNDVSYACEAGAIDTCMCTDELFRANDVAERKKYIALAEAVEKQGGTFVVFSTLHVSGERLRDLTGIAAILRYKLEIPKEEDDDDLSDDLKDM